MRDALGEIEKKCGMVGFILVGGPEPMSGGELTFMACVLFYSSCIASLRQQLLIILIISRTHTGATRHGLDFSEAYTGWKTHIEEPFVEYLNHIYSASALFFYTITSINGTQPVNFASALHCQAPYRRQAPLC
jgi:hypothetical protein